MQSISTSTTSDVFRLMRLRFPLIPFYMFVNTRSDYSQANRTLACPFSLALYERVLWFFQFVFSELVLVSALHMHSPRLSFFMVT